MINHFFLEKISKTSNMKKIQDKLLIDFLNRLQSFYDFKLSDNELSELTDVVLKTSAFNSHDKVFLSDLWAICKSDLFNDDSNLSIFKDNLFFFIFKQEQEEFEEIKKIKFANANEDSAALITPEQRENLEKAILLVESYIKKLEARNKDILNSEEFKNLLTEDEFLSFYLTSYDHMVGMLKWQKLGCEINLGK